MGENESAAVMDDVTRDDGAEVVGTEDAAAAPVDAGGEGGDASPNDGSQGQGAAAEEVAGDGAEGEAAADGAAVEGSAEVTASVAVAGSRRRTAAVQDLEEEGEVAADYLEELLDIVDVDGDIDIDVENGRASLAIVAEGGSDRVLRRLIGPNGEVLEALQELTRLAVQASTGERSRLMLDIAGHRAARRRELSAKAAEVCAEVKRTGAPVSMRPMTAFERKIVHDVVATEGLTSESEGADPQRHVVIHPAS